MATLGKIGRIKGGRPRKPSMPKPRTGRSAARRVSPLKPGLAGARNWTTAQLRSAKYSKKKKIRMIIGGILLVLAVLWTGLWLGGFIPNIQAAKNRAVKHRLMSMGFVVKHIDVVGEGRISETEIRSALGVRSGDYLFDMDLKNAQDRVQSISWVENAVVRRLWPNRIVVHVNERIPYALWQDNQTLHLVDQTGFAINNVLADDYADIPFLVGNGANENADQFLKILSQYKYLDGKASAYIYVGQRRWDIVLKNNNGRILLPEENPNSALKQLEKYNEMHALFDLDLEKIDLRVQGRIYLKPRASVKNSRNVKRV